MLLLTSPIRFQLIITTLMTSSHTKGLALVAFSALLFSTPGLFTRAVQASGWEVVFWRGVSGAIVTAAYLAWRGAIKQEFRRVGSAGWLMSIVWASGSIAFIQAFKFTSIANVSLIYGSSALMTALLAWVWFAERPRKIVVVASLLIFAGVVIIAGGSFGSLHFTGDLLALWMTFTGAFGFAVMRKYPGISAGATTILASVLSLPACLIWGDVWATAPHEIFILAIFGVVFALAATMMTEGAKLLPASEAALVSNLEIPVQPVLAWWIFAELPPRATFCGGALVLAAIVLSSWPSRQPAP